MRTPSLWSLWAIAFAARLAALAAALVYLPGLVTADARGLYLPIAASLAAGHGYAVRGDALDASRVAPLFPCWLALLAQLGGSPPPLWLIGVANAALRAAACVLLFLIARRYFGARAALGAFLLYLLDPWEWFWTGYVLKESLAVPLFLLAVWMLVRLADQPAVICAAAAGVTVGVATLARFPSGVLLVVGWLVLWRALRLPGGKGSPRPFARRALGLGVYLTLGMAVTLAPWMVRNWMVVGQPVLSTHFIGRYLYTSNARRSTMETDGYMTVRGRHAGALPDPASEGRHLTQREGELASRALRDMTSRQGLTVVRVVRKMLNMWRPTFAAASRVNVLALALPYCILMGISAAGVVIAVRKRMPCLSVAATLVIFFLVHLVFWGEIRNRQYLLPLLYCFAGLAVAEASRRAKIKVASVVPK